MSSVKEYIVSLNRNVDYDSFWYEMENLSEKDNFVPERRIDIVNNRDGSLRNCHYALTDEEANILRHDPRVYSVEIPPDQRTDIVIGKKGYQYSNFDKPLNSTSGVNWGLKRSSSIENLYSTGLSSPDGIYNYILDGTGVDYVIQDSGIEVYHPEFSDANGQTRVQLINWYTESGLSGTQSANHYRDFDGHGTHVAAISVGKTFGWAKNSRIYSLKVRGLEGTGDTNTGILISDCFDVIKLWHRKKPIDPRTGFKRPTVVNMSWGYFLQYLQSNLSEVNYRGVAYTDSTTVTNASYRWTNYGLVPLFDGTNYLTNIRLNSVDVDVQELIDEGIHVVIAAGNQYHKIDMPGNPDYDNYIVVSGVPRYYHRGSSPYDDEAFKVGNLDSSVVGSNVEHKAHSSENGPAVDIYAPGSNVISACSNTNAFGAVAYYQNSSFKQVNLTGTSQASPQIAGMVALYLQMNPSASPAQVKNWIINKSAVNNLYTTVSNVAYTDTLSLNGGGNRMLYNPFAIRSDGTMKNGIVLNNGAFTLIK